MTYLDYLQTFRRLPDDVVLAVAGREIDPGSPQRCLCGWAIREALARELNLPASEIDPYEYVYRPPMAGINGELAKRYGGRVEEWHNIFSGIVLPGSEADVELAFTTRVLECV